MRRLCFSCGGATGGGKWRGMGSTHGGGESSVSVNYPASEASKESAERRERGDAGRKDIAIIIK